MRKAASRAEALDTAEERWRKFPFRLNFTLATPRLNSGASSARSHSLIVLILQSPS